MVAQSNRIFRSLSFSSYLNEIFKENVEWHEGILRLPSINKKKKIGEIYVLKSTDYETCTFFFKENNYSHPSKYLSQKSI